MPPAVGIRVLVFVEVKVHDMHTHLTNWSVYTVFLRFCLWNIANSAIVGFAMSSDDFSCVHDIYEDVSVNEKCHICHAVSRERLDFRLQCYWPVFHLPLHCWDVFPSLHTNSYNASIYPVELCCAGVTSWSVVEVAVWTLKWYRYRNHMAHVTFWCVLDGVSFTSGRILL